MSHSGQFPHGEFHPKAIDLKEREQVLAAMPLGTLKIIIGSIRRAGRSRLVVDAACSACGITKQYLVDNIMGAKTKGCMCRRNRKYHDDRAETLGRRYDAMVQRCERDSHVSSHHYKGRGIKVEFVSREEFILWALETFPDTDFKGLDFDRIDNNGNYSKGNLRLVSRRENLLNRKR